MSAPYAWFFFSFSGRISRQQFWLGYALTIVVMMLLIPRLQDLLLALAGPPPTLSRREIGWISMVIASLIVTFPLLALYVKRLHDFDMSGWFLLAFFAAAVVAEMLGFGLRNASVALVGCIGFVPGKRGDNRFGPDPIVTRN